MICCFCAFEISSTHPLRSGDGDLRLCRQCALRKSGLIHAEGPSIIADMENAGIENSELNFSARKSEMASLLKQRMANHQFFYPLLNWSAYRAIFVQS